MAFKRPTAVYIAAGIMFILSTVAVVLRFIARSRVTADLWWDDWMILASLPFYYALASLIVTDVALWGLCWPMEDIHPFLHLAPFLKTVVPIQTLYLVSNFLVKVSLLLLYYRLFNPNRTWRHSVQIVAAIITAWFISFFIASICTCVPLRKLWNPTISGRCSREVVFAYGNTISNMILDFMILCLPFPIIYHLKIELRIRISLAAIFLLGFFVCAISIARITSVNVLSRSRDFTLDSCELDVLSFIEPGCGIIAACLPTLKPLIPRFSKLNVTSFYKNRKNSGGLSYASNLWTKAQSTSRDPNDGQNGRSFQLRGEYQGFEKMPKYGEEARSVPLRDIESMDEGEQIGDTIHLTIGAAKGLSNSDAKIKIPAQARWRHDLER